MKPLPPHIRCYLEAFEKVLRADTDYEARVMRKRSDRHLEHMLEKAGVKPDREKHPKRESNFEAVAEMNIPAGLLLALGENA